MNLPRRAGRDTPAPVGTAEGLAAQRTRNGQSCSLPVSLAPIRAFHDHSIALTEGAAHESSPPSIAGQLADALHDGGWRARARLSQLPPDGDWRIWLILTGRGWGKTWTAANWITEQALASTCRLALIGATSADVRDTMIEGSSGILNTAPTWARPTYEPSKRKIEWPNGSVAHAFSAEESDRLRGPEFHAGWIDELAAFDNDQATYDMLMMGMRLGTRPRLIITTTPRPKKLIRSLLSREDVAVVRGSTHENADNLAPGFIHAITDRYQGTRLGRQEISAKCC